MNGRDVMKQALEALNLPSMKTQQMLQQRDEAITALRERLEQQAEPVHGDIRALRYRIFELEGENLGYKRMLDVAEAPPQRKPLTDEEIEAAFLKCNGKWDGDQWVIEDADFHPFARAIEAAHGIGETP